MPPKKQEQLQIAQYKPCFVLPIFINGPKSQAAAALGRPVTVKKNIDQAKIIQILKDKGLEQYIVNGQINQKGRIFAAENLKTVSDEFIASLSKPADPKKDAKKDAKKQAKKQEPVVENTIPPIQIQFQKNCNDFFVYLSVPSNPKQLQTALSKEIKFDIIVLIQQKIKPGSRKPNYDLLNNQKSVQDISQMMKSTLVDPDFMDKKQNNSKANYEINAKKMVEILKMYKSNLPNDNPNKNVVILSVPFLNNLSKPQENDTTFIRSFFERVCKCTKQLQQFTQWKNTRKLVPMIEPIKQVITKQVQVQEKADKNKKGGKSAEPVFETVTQTIEKRYEDQPQNIKSDLKDYFKVKKVKQSSNLMMNKNTGSVYEDILVNCIQSLAKESGQKGVDFIDNLAAKVKSQNQIRPINKMNTECVANRLRNINYYKNITMNCQTYFEFKPLQSQFSYVELTQKSTQPLQELKMQFLIDKFENLAKSANSKIKWNFKDRDYIENFSKDQLIAIINEQLLYDPEIFAGILQSQRKRLLILSRTNPPGRVLYHNSIFNWKVLPDFQNWTDFFLNSQQNMKVEEFFNYPFQNAGNLAVKAKNMMPADNTIIRDQIYTIGSNRSNIIQIFKENSKFGLTKNKLKNGEDAFVYWHQIDEQYRLRAYKTTKTKKVVQQKKQEKQNEQKQNSLANEHKYETLDVALANKKQYRAMLDPNPTFYWINPQQQLIRSFDSFGSITSYRKDGSIHIYTPEAEITIQKNGKWTTFTNENQTHTELSEGESQIKIREDQTIIITDSKGNKKTLFPDGTQIIENVKDKIREIKSPRGPIVRICLPRDYNLNVIGYGSAFAYLGFRNILERSYDGYLFQIIDADISSHFYTERYEKDGKIKTEQVRLIAYQDGSHLKINCSSGTIIFNSPTPNQALTEQVLNQRWLQTYTTKSNHGEGVFDIDLNIGHIENKDSETNKFVAKINDRSQAQIAVSFITEDEEGVTNVFPSGFHIKQQNYFLPPPKNFIPARLFSINEDGSGTEYLSNNQIGNMSKYSVTKQYQGVRTITQYSKEISPANGYLNVSFSKPVNTELFGFPDVLKTPETKQSLIPVRFYDVAHRVLENITWKYSFQSIRKLEQELQKQRKDKESRKQSRKIQRKQEKQVTIQV